jgi:predicted protein tyrosine phosphatase
MSFFVKGFKESSKLVQEGFDGPVISVLRHAESVLGPFDPNPHLTLPVDDIWLPSHNGHFFTVAHAQQAVQFGIAHSLSEAPVLVHCAAGISRSSAVAACLEFAVHGTDPQAAFEEMALLRLLDGVEVVPNVAVVRAFADYLGAYSLIEGFEAFDDASNHRGCRVCAEPWKECSGHVPAHVM